MSGPASRAPASCVLPASCGGVTPPSPPPTLTGSAATAHASFASLRPPLVALPAAKIITLPEAGATTSKRTRTSAPLRATGAMWVISPLSIRVPACPAVAMSVPPATAMSKPPALKSARVLVRMSVYVPRAPAASVAGPSMRVVAPGFTPWQLFIAPHPRIARPVCEPLEFARAALAPRLTVSATSSA